LSHSDNSSSDNPQTQFDSQSDSQLVPQLVSTELHEPPQITSDSLAPATLTATLLPPPRDPVWSGWDVLLIAGLGFVSVLVLQLTVLVAAKLLIYPQASLADVAQKPIVLLVSQFLIYIPIAVCMFVLVEGKYHVPFWQAIRWNWPDAQWGLAALALGAIMLVALSLLQIVLPMPKDTPFDHLFDRPRDAYLLALLAVTIGPLMEELFFRGFMYPVLERRIGMMWGVLLTALPFGLLHLQQYGWAWAAGLVIFLVGVVCGVVRAVTKSVAASFLVHVGYNGTQMLIAIVATHGFRHMEKAALLKF
jgi:CAAX protease family protein